MLNFGVDGCEFGEESSSVRKACTRAFFADGAGERYGEFDVQGFRAKLASLPDIERALEGRVTGSGGAGVSETCTSGGRVSAVCAPVTVCVSGIGVSGAFAVGPSVSPSTGLVKSSLETVNRETAMVAFSRDRREVRRKMSFPAATSSLGRRIGIIWVCQVGKGPSKAGGAGFGGRKVG